MPSSTATPTRILSLPQIGEAITRGKWRGHYRHTRFICKRLMRAVYTSGSRCLLNMPPRHGKTILAARILPFFYLAQWPDRDVVYVSSTGPAAAEQGEAIQQLIDEFGPSFGIKVSSKSKAKDNFDIVDLNGRPTGGSMRCFGITSSVHGRNAHLLVVDDLFGTIEDALSAANRETVWRTYTSALYTRLAPHSSVVAIGTPFHADDWFGRIATAQEAGGDKWERIKLKAFAGPDDPLGRKEGEPLWPEGGWTTERLNTTRNAMEAGGNGRDWCAQYELEPVYGDGVSDWPKEYFADHIWVDTRPAPDKTVARVLAIDPSVSDSGTGDYAAFCDATLGTDGHVYFNVTAHRRGLAAVYETALALVRQSVAENRPYQLVLNESNGAQKALTLRLRELLLDAQILIPVHDRESKGDKATRIKLGLDALLAAKRIHFLGRTQGNLQTVQQARDLPHGQYDDNIDACEMAVFALHSLSRPTKAPQRTVLRA
ncbi:Terminase-like family protein [Gemmata sp. SH-PL17]|uniref:terminase large subunit domain-containing protein n=1 Tax=Gemmata sp. SH-PL17 TaxID=1630693 RepID=UPI00078B91FD|nr:terminase family protein [Gemmata sp. SH-PL17]AMV25427.1 Terminase-like family protein [Gemmata sp. SH-PL17]